MVYISRKVSCPLAIFLLIPIVVPPAEKKLSSKKTVSTRQKIRLQDLLKNKFSLYRKAAYAMKISKKNRRNLCPLAGI